MSELTEEDVAKIDAAPETAPTPEPELNGLDKAFESEPDNTVEPTEAPTEPTEQKLFAGKFSTPEELEKGYQELYKSFMTRNEIPETYEVSKTMEELGITIQDETRWNETVKTLKEHKFTQAQTEFMLKQAAEFRADVEQAIVSQYGPLPNLEEQKAILKQEWGADAKVKVQSTLNWAKENLPPALYRTASLDANTLKWVNEQMNNSKTPTAMTDTISGVGTVTKAELEALVANPLYTQLNDAGERFRAEAKRKFEIYAQQTRGNKLY